jgi:hypothetical protein
MPTKKPKRRHGLSRLEKLLQDSIRHELAIKRMKNDLVRLSLEFSMHCAKSDSSEVWPWEPPGVYGGGSGLDRNTP